MCNMEMGLSYTTSPFGKSQLQNPLQRGQNPISRGVCSVLSGDPPDVSAKEQLSKPLAARGGEWREGCCVAVEHLESACSPFLQQEL